MVSEILKGLDMPAPQDLLMIFTRGRKIAGQATVQNVGASPLIAPALRPSSISNLGKIYRALLA